MKRIAAVVRLELLVQRREPLPVLYVLVFGLLAAAFAAAGPVDLVRNRGAVPRDSAWAMMLATTALTAFGQVITTMVAATVVLRDRADRVQDFVVASRLGSREYLTGKLLAALVVLCVIYGAIPFGLVIGAVLAGGGLTQAIVASVPPFVVLVLPTMLAVGALQFAIGVLSGRLWVIVGQGLVLIWLWTAATDAVGGAHTDAARSLLLLDPFGSAPLLHATRFWSDAERASRAMPVTFALLAGRVLWLGVGVGAAVVAILRGARVSAPRAVIAISADARPASAVSERPVAVAGRPRAWRGAVGTAVYVSRWMLRDTGWRVLAVLGALNVCVHVWVDVRHDATGDALVVATLSAVRTHGRLFLILLATIYAGELVWREREERSAASFDAVPVSTTAMLVGRVAGGVVAQCVLVAMLVTCGALTAIVASRETFDVLLCARVAAGSVLAPFIGVLLVSLAVHAAVQQKVAGHLLLIAGWVSASLVGTAAAVSGAGSKSGVTWGVMVAISLAATRVCWRRGAQAA